LTDVPTQLFVEHPTPGLHFYDAGYDIYLIKNANDAAVELSRLTQTRTRTGQCCAARRHDPKSETLQTYADFAREQPEGKWLRRHWQTPELRRGRRILPSVSQVHGHITTAAYSSLEHSTGQVLLSDVLRQQFDLYKPIYYDFKNLDNSNFSGAVLLLPRWLTTEQHCSVVLH
jgi:hypothetical protein